MPSVQESRIGNTTFRKPQGMLNLSAISEKESERDIID